MNCNHDHPKLSEFGLEVDSFSVRSRRSGGKRRGWGEERGLERGEGERAGVSDCCLEQVLKHAETLHANWQALSRIKSRSHCEKTAR